MFSNAESIMFSVDFPSLELLRIHHHHLIIAMAPLFLHHELSLFDFFSKLTLRKTKTWKFHKVGFYNSTYIPFANVFASRKQDNSVIKQGIL